MSGFQTHGLVGAVGGLGLVTFLEATSPMVLPERIGATPTIIGVPGGAGGAAVIIASALLALVPDIDEPHSFVAQRVREVLLLVGLALGVALGILARGPVWWPIAAGVVGGGAGLLSGRWLLKGIRAAAGGHRRFTHSLVLAGGLALLAGGLWWTGAGLVWLLPAAFAWGIVLHDLADLVTPSGVPLLYPISEHRVRVLPSALAPFGELLISAAAMCAAWAMLST